jgi:predicted nucleic acid-binding protein
MPVLVDTCGWIEWLTDGELAGRYESLMQFPEALVIPTAVQFELYKWVKREIGEVEALDTIALGDGGLIVPLTTTISLMAADLALEHGLSFADAIIYATARYSRAELITSDDHFLGLPGVTYFPKS